MQSAGEMPFTCTTCNRRKVKCDKAVPACSACRKSRLACEYGDMHLKTQRRRRKAGGGAAERRRPAALEVAEAQSPPSPPPLRVEKQEERQSLDEGSLLADSRPKWTRYVDEARWDDNVVDGNGGLPAMAQGVRGGGEGVLGRANSQLEFDLAAETTTTTTAAAAASSSTTSVLSSATTALLHEAHPSREHGLELWSVYVGNVDPLLKTIHVPTLAGFFDKATADPSAVPAEEQSLMFAVYHFAIISLGEEECRTRFGEGRAVLQRRYHDAARRALTTCSFLKTVRLEVLQAYCLLLVAVRNICDTQMLWIESGVAVRIAQRMGLHRRDERAGGGGGGVDPYAEQMRCRLWWQLIILDSRAGQISGAGTSIAPESWRAAVPLNVDDADIWPGMGERPRSRTGATDMYFVLARIETAMFHQNRYPMMIEEPEEEVGEEEFGAAIKTLEARLEEKFIRYCDVTKPLHWLTVTMSRAILSYGSMRTLQLLIRKRGIGTMTREQRLEIFRLASHTLDCDISCHLQPAVAGFLWAIRVFFQWDPLVCVLNEFCRTPVLVPIVESWQRVDRFLSFHPELTSRQQSLDLAVGKLALKAWDHAVEIYRQDGQSMPIQVPVCITTLRECFGQQNPLTQPVPAFRAGEERAKELFMDDLFDVGVDETIDWTFWDEMIFTADVPL